MRQPRSWSEESMLSLMLSRYVVYYLQTVAMMGGLHASSYHLSIFIDDDQWQTTLGPRGRNVVLMRDVGYPEVINDGVTIARDINLPGKWAWEGRLGSYVTGHHSMWCSLPLSIHTDPAMNVGAKLIKAVASKSDSIAGDGTTTSTLMTQVLINKGYRMIMAGKWCLQSLAHRYPSTDSWSWWFNTGANAVGVWRGMKKASEILVGKLKGLARPVSSSEDIHAIGTVASGSAVMVRRYVGHDTADV